MSLRLPGSISPSPEEGDEDDVSHALLQPLPPSPSTIQHDSPRSVIRAISINGESRTNMTINQPLPISIPIQITPRSMNTPSAMTIATPSGRTSAKIQITMNSPIDPIASPSMVVQPSPSPPLSPPSPISSTPRSSPPPAPAQPQAQPGTSHRRRRSSVSRPPLLIHIRDYYEGGAHGVSGLSSEQPPPSVWPNCYTRPGAPTIQANVDVTVDGHTTTIAQLLQLYQAQSGRPYLHQPFLFLTPAAAVADAAVTSSLDGVVAPAAPSSSAMPSVQRLASVIRGKETPAALIRRGQGHRVHLPTSEFHRTLQELDVATGSILTIRTQPYALQVMVDNSALLEAGVPSTQVDTLQFRVWVEDHMTIEQLKDELIRQLRENQHVLGASRLRLFYQRESISATGSNDLVELTQDLTRMLGTLPIVAWTPTTPSSRCTLFLRKDPTRWLHHAIRAHDLAQAEALIRLGADAHLLDARGNSAFYYAAPKEDMSLLLQKYFPPSPKELEAVTKLLKSYSNYLHGGACIQLISMITFFLSPTDIRTSNEERYAFVTQQQPARVITNEIHKPLGLVNISGGNLGNRILPTMIGTATEDINGTMSHIQNNTDPALPPLYPKYDKTPSVLLFDLSLDLSETPVPKRIILRSPPYLETSRENPEITRIAPVSKFRAVITRFDVFKNRYMMNIKMAMLFASAIGACYSFSFAFNTQGVYGKEELIAQFVCTILKAIIAILFFTRMVCSFGFDVAKSFVSIKNTLLLPKNKPKLRETYLYFFLLEACDVATIIANVRILATLTADGVSLSKDNFAPVHPKPMTDAESMSLSIFLSLLSLVAVNVLDTIISFLADETPSMLTKVHRYFALHFMVMISCFSSLRLIYDLRELQLTPLGQDAHTITNYITPVTINFVLSYLFGLSVKNLNVTFHPIQNHKLMDEHLTQKSIEIDSRCSLFYILLAFIFYGSFANPQGHDVDVLAQKSEIVGYHLALLTFFLAGVILSCTAFLPFLMRVINPDEKIEWIPELFQQVELILDDVHALTQESVAVLTPPQALAASSQAVDRGFQVVKETIHQVGTGLNEVIMGEKKTDEQETLLKKS